MGSKNEEKPVGNTGWFQGLKAEFNKIIWPDKKTLIKESVAVIIIAVIIGCLVALLDGGLAEGFRQLRELVQNMMA